MKFYPENLVVRILFCVVVLIVLTIAASYVGRTFIFHEPFTISVVTNIIVPVICGVMWAYSWKPKE